jgi:hypothetical protein
MIYEVHGILTVRHDKPFFNCPSVDSKRPYRELPFTTKFGEELRDFTFVPPIGIFCSTELSSELIPKDFFLKAWNHDGSSARRRQMGDKNTMILSGVNIQ